MLRSAPLVRRARMYARTFASVPRAPYDVLFCGTDAFARTALEHILARKELTRSVQVLTPPDVAHKWGGRRMRVAPVKELAADASLPILHVPQGGMDEFALPEALQSSDAPMLITVSFGHRIPTSLLGRFSSPSLTLNLHPSLLPELRGAAPIQWALAREYTTTGVSVQQLHAERFDVGKLLAQEPVSIPNDSTYASLAPILADAGAALLVDTMAHLPERSADAKVQDDACATRAPKLQAKYGVVHWAKWDAQRIGARIRGFGHQIPITTTLVPSRGTFPQVACTLRDARPLSSVSSEPLALLDAQAQAKLFGAGAAPGTAVYSETLQALVVRCATPENVLLVYALQTQGKPVRKAPDWWLGFHDRSDEQHRLHFR